MAQNRTWKIIGDNNLVVVDAKARNLPRKFKKMISAIGLINVGCTGTHIGNGIVLTAGHCFWAPAEVAHDSDCSDIEIEWGHRETMTPYLKSQCEKILFMQNDFVQNDFAILKVSPAPKAKVDVELSRAATLGDDITIFSHADELPLQWSNICQVEADEYSDLPELSLKHNCDTKAGSSGAAIIDANTLKVVAIHDGGRLNEDLQGMNYGTRLTSPEVVKALQSLGF